MLGGREGERRTQLTLGDSYMPVSRLVDRRKQSGISPCFVVITALFAAPRRSPPPEGNS